MIVHSCIYPGGLRTRANTTAPQRKPQRLRIVACVLQVTGSCFRRRPSSKQTPQGLPKRATGAPNGRIQKWIQNVDLIFVLVDHFQNGRLKIVDPLSDPWICGVDPDFRSQTLSAGYCGRSPDATERSQCMRIGARRKILDPRLERAS